jgi:pimeloyl-ACP methyl ester carboxylesterase
MNERPLQFGEGGRIFAIYTQPVPRGTSDEQLPAIVMLSAGMLHRVGPFRLHVGLARQLAADGFPVFRVDLAGKGDSPIREGMANQPSVTADFEEIVAGIKGMLPSVDMVLLGMCSGADNAIRLAISEPSVIGTVLLDPVCPRDAMFRVRSLKKYLSPVRYMNKLKEVVRKMNSEETSAGEEEGDPLLLRDLPSHAQMQESFRLVRDRNGSVLAIFTQYAFGYYSKEGQLKSVLGIEGFDSFVVERHWPDTEHTWKLDLHRERLTAEIVRWANHLVARRRR